MVSVSLGKYVYSSILIRLSEVFPAFLVWLMMALSRPVYASLHQAISGVMSVELCLHVESQASQHFRSSEMQAICGGCFVCWAIYSSHCHMLT